jgi:hypothetical protein
MNAHYGRDMPRNNQDDVLVSLEAQRDAVRYATGAGSSLEGILAAISADITRQQAEKRSANTPPVSVIKTAKVNVMPNDNSWPEALPFPLTPLEAWNLLQGHSVRPAKSLSPEDLKRLPLDIEENAGYLRINCKSR